MYDSYDAFTDHINLLSPRDQILFVAELTTRTEKDAYRLFSRAHVWIVEGYKSTEDVGSLDALILSAFTYADPRFKTGILRSTYNARRYLKHWHNLRDNAHAHLQETETPERAKRLMVGFYEEYRNSTILFTRFTPHRSLWSMFPQEHLWPRPNWRKL